VYDMPRSTVLELNGRVFILELWLAGQAVACHPP